MGTDKDPKTWKLSPSPLDPEGRFPPLLFRILSYATLLMLLALFPAAFLFGDEPRDDVRALRTALEGTEGRVGTPSPTSDHCGGPRDRRRGVPVSPPLNKKTGREGHEPNPSQIGVTNQATSRSTDTPPIKLKQRGRDL